MSVRHSPLPRLEEWQRKLVESHKRYAISLANPYRPRWGDDAISTAYIGLVEAAARFDRSKDRAFTTYSIWWIRACLLELTMKDRGPVRIGKRRDDRIIYFGMARARRAVGDSAQDIANYLSEKHGLEIKTKDVERMKSRILGGDVEIDADTSTRTKDAKAALIYPDNPERQYEGEEGKHHIRGLLKILPERQQEIIRRRWMTDDPETFEEIGKDFGVSRERIRQLEVKAFERMKKECCRLGLESSLLET